MTETAIAPLTAEILRNALKNEDFIAFPATLADYDRLSDNREFSLHYVQNQIMGTMSYCTENHELIVINMASLFNFAFENCKVMGSNRPIYVEEVDEIFEPDVQVVMGETQVHRYGKSKTATVNPVVVVEVHSNSTKEFDLTIKLNAYKQIPTLQNIIFIEQDKPHISIYSRTKRPNEWLNADLTDLTQKIRVLGTNFPLSKIYNKVIFTI
ncbi:MAG: Uma2 family endonuclease [Saprospiraceae bacterium]|nr:Uma2 family endonuclease [Saprospiraceae bacterium]